MKRIGYVIAKLANERKLFDTILSGIQFVLVGIFKLIGAFISLLFKVIKLPFRGVDYLVGAFSRMVMAKSTPVENKVMFLTFQGDYTCNPKYIAEELIRENVDCTLIWDVKGQIPNCDYPLNLKFVQHDTYEFYKEMASSKVIIENTNIVERLGAYKKKNQYLFQTWHGSLGIKRLDGDVVMGFSWKQLAKKCQKNVDFLLSNSDFESEVFRTAYWKNTPALMVGHARNDIFFTEDEDFKNKIKKKVYTALGIDMNKKIFLYAPTHRDDVGESFHAFNYGAVKAALEERFGGEWQIVLRFHNRLRKQSRNWLRHLPDFVSDATMYGDMQELLLCTECGVTDYSSWIFDYVLGRKPGFIVEVGLEDYENSRGFYYPIETTPFPIAKNFKQLCTRIKEFDADKYQTDIDRFLQERGCMEDGHASERIVAKIKELLEA